MSKRSEWLWRSLVVLLVLVLGTAMYLHSRSTPLNGWWLKESGGGPLPEQMTVNISNGTYTRKYLDSLGVTTLKLPIDGRAHRLSSLSEPITGVVTVTTCWAELKGDTLLLTTKIEEIPPKPEWGRIERAWTESWSVKPDRRLVISELGKPDVVYVRAPWWVHLWRSAP